MYSKCTIDWYMVATHLENGEKSGGNIFDEKVREIHEKLSKSGKMKLF